MHIKRFLIVDFCFNIAYSWYTLESTFYRRLIMIKHFFFLRKETSDLMKLKMKSVGINHVSEYVRNLIDNDIKNISNRKSVELSNHLKLIEIQLDNKSNEILQRCLILSRLMLEQMIKSGNKSFSGDNIQKLVNGFIEEAKNKYPVL